MNLSKPQSKALDWLRERSGDGVFDRNGVLIACGESAPFMRSTWNALRDAGLIEFYGSGRGRARLTKAAGGSP